jgi:hypothetical protein
MQSVNIFSVDKPEGRLDVAQWLSSGGLMMFLQPGFRHQLEPLPPRVRGGVASRRERHARSARARRRAPAAAWRPRSLPARTRRSAQGDESQRRIGKNTDLVYQFTEHTRPA